MNSFGQYHKSCDNHPNSFSSFYSSVANDIVFVNAKTFWNSTFYNIFLWCIDKLLFHFYHCFKVIDEYQPACQVPVIPLRYWYPANNRAIHRYVERAAEFRYVCTRYAILVPLSVEMYRCCNHDRRFLFIENLILVERHLYSKWSVISRNQEK